MLARKFFKIGIALALLYAALLSGLLVAMYQPPATFGRIMAKIPRVIFLAPLPFRPLWLFARAGRLKLGDVAPDFSLETANRKSRVRLSDHRGQKPVVLVFGSYT